MKLFGWEAECIPTIQLKQEEFELSEYNNRTKDAIIFTSEMAVKGFCSNNGSMDFLMGKSVYSTNGATLNALKLSGISPDYSGANASLVGEEIIKSGSVKSVLHVCGNLALPILGEVLSNHSISYSQLIVYTNKPEYIATLKTKYDAVLFYSPSGIDGFRHNNPFSDDVVYCSIGNTTASYLNGLSSGLKHVVSTGNSTGEMISELHKFLSNT